jgi:hypothetical protein
MQKLIVVAERLQQHLRSQWLEFLRQPEARLLRWMLTPVDVGPVQTFLRRVNEEEWEPAYHVQGFEVPFDKPEEYGWALREVLLAKVAGWQQAGLESPPPWSCPCVEPGQQGAAAFFAACDSLQRHVTEHYEYEGLAVVLSPRSLTDPRAWQRWLWQALDLITPLQVRLVVVGNPQAPVLKQMAAMEDRRVWTAVAGSPAARESASPTPTERYQRLWGQLMEARAGGELQQLRHWGAAAVQLAAEQEWYSLEVMALVAMAEPLLVAGCTEEAIPLYTQALAIAHMAMGKGEPKGWEVLRSAQFGMAGALAAAQRWQQAAGQYEVLAMQSFGAEPVVELECRRMAAWCYEHQTSGAAKTSELRFSARQGRQSLAPA